MDDVSRNEEGSGQVPRADEAANIADTHEPSFWTTGKDDIRSEAEIAREETNATGVASSHAEQLARAEVAEEENRHGAQRADFNLATGDSSNEIVKALTPEGLTNLRVTEIERTAAGIPAVVSTMRHALREMGVIRAARTLLAMNQKGGFDCQSCAWADPDGERHVAEFCENGAKAVADEATRRRVTPDFFKRYSVAELSHKSDYWLGKQGRITHPMFLPVGATHYEPIFWDDAFRLIASELNALASPDEALFYTSGRASNEAAFLYQLFVRQFGTNNLPDCSNMCHESSGTAMMEAIGIGKGTIKLEDFDLCDLIIIIGQNPGTNHPRMLTSLEAAKRRGAKILSINPLPEAGLLGVVNPNPQEYPNPLKFPVAMLSGKGTTLSDLHLPIKINGDMALLKGMMKIMLDEETRRPGTALDRDFIERDTAGFDDFKNALDSVSWQDITEQSGLSRELIERAAQMYTGARGVITCWAMGLTQHRNAVGTIQEIVNLHLLRGQIGKRGAGLCPVRGHSNVQGDRSVGIWERPREEFLKALDEEFGMKSPRHHGYDTIEAIKAMYVNRCKVFFALGGNFLSATPDTEYTAKALRRTRLTAHVLTKLNRSTLVTGEQALILPCLGRSEVDLQSLGEQFVSCENSMGVVQMSKGILKPASEHLRSEPWIVARLAKATLGNRTTVNWDAVAADYDRIRDHIERVIPGFEKYNERVRQPAGFYLPNLPREGVFPTATGKANFTVHELPLNRLMPGQFAMMTIRSHDQFNTTIYGLDDRYRGIRGARRVVLLNREDMREHSLEANQIVDLTSHFTDGERHARRFVVVPYDIPRRSAATYFPEANVLVPIGSAADRSNTPTSKYVIITITPHEHAGATSDGGKQLSDEFDYDHVDGQRRAGA